jgi:hypothetical protein
MLDVPASSYALGPEPQTELDLVTRVKGMYRILDLISEPGSGGLGDYFP